MRDVRVGDAITGFVLGAALLGVVFFSYNRDMEQYGMRAAIREEVKAEMDRRYRNVPRINIAKVYTLQANGQDVAVETDGSGYGEEVGSPY